MTREEAITVIKELMKNPIFCDEHTQAFNIAIHDIKQRHDWDINNLILINKDNYESLEQEPTTKNDLGVDKTFYEQIVEYCNEHFLVLVEKDVWEDARKALTTENDLVDAKPVVINKIKDECSCPHCGKYLFDDEWIYTHTDYKYCPYCGEKIIVGGKEWQRGIEQETHQQKHKN